MMGWWIAALVGISLVAIYGLVLWQRPATLPQWRPWRTTAWGAGAITVALALSPPLSELAHHNHLYHMAQHLLLGMYAPLALVLGAPVTLLLGSLPRHGQLALTGVLRSIPVHILTHPITAAMLNVGGMFVLYLTPLYLASIDRPWLHALVLTHFLVAGYLFTWAIAGPDPAPRRPRMATRVTVLIAAAGAHAFLAKILYADAANLAGHHGSVENVEAAAQWMYYGGDGAEVVLAVMLFTRWARHRWSRTLPRSPLSQRPGPTVV